MTSQQIQIIKTSWHIFQHIDPVLVGDVFYSKLFLMEPRLEQLFTNSRNAQSAKLVEMLNVIVGRLDRLDELTEDIKNLAIRHVNYGALPAHYKAVGNALLWTLEQGLGKDWNDDVKRAWTACYKILSETMISAADSFTAGAGKHGNGLRSTAP